MQCLREGGAQIVLGLLRRCQWLSFVCLSADPNWREVAFLVAEAVSRDLATKQKKKGKTVVPLAAG
jgi:hypothetical protein